ncbi:MAG: TrkA C-terminal domain-containing protein [Halobacteriaceae archaeon]
MGEDDQYGQGSAGPRIDVVLDEIDERILYHLAREARHTSAPDITADVDVSAATIRNRIDQLEDSGVIQGYHAHVDYERASGKLTYLFICNTDPARREYFAKEALEIPGVIHVRELMSGRRHLHVEVVGENKAEISRIARELSTLGIDIEDEAMVQSEYHHPYEPWGPTESMHATGRDVTNLRELAGGAKVLDVTVAEDAPAAGQTIRALSEAGDLREDLLIVAVERGEETITPNGQTRIEPGDLISVFSQDGDTESLVQLFTGATPPLDTA